MRWCLFVLATGIIGGICGASVGSLTAPLIKEPLWPTALWMLGTVDGLAAGMAICPPLFGKNQSREEIKNINVAGVRFGVGGAYCGAIGGWTAGIACGIVNAGIGMLISAGLKQFECNSEQDKIERENPN